LWVLKKKGKHLKRRVAISEGDGGYSCVTRANGRGGSGEEKLGLFIEERQNWAHELRRVGMGRWGGRTSRMVREGGELVALEERKGVGVLIYGLKPQKKG